MLRDQLSETHEPQTRYRRQHVRMERVQERMSGRLFLSYQTTQVQYRRTEKLFGKLLRALDRGQKYPMEMRIYTSPK